MKLNPIRIPEAKPIVIPTVAIEKPKLNFFASRMPAQSVFGSVKQETLDRIDEQAQRTVDKLNSQSEPIEIQPTAIDEEIKNVGPHETLAEYRARIANPVPAQQSESGPQFKPEIALVMPSQNTIDLAAKLAETPIAPAPLIAPFRLFKPNSPDVVPAIREATHAGNAAMAASDVVINKPMAPIDLVVPKKVTRTELVAADFPFDESQLGAIKGIASQKHACLTGSAGTGKTTVTKAIVNRIHEDLESVNMAEYWNKAVQPDDDDYSMPEEKLVPAVALCAYTGKASQMIKKNFPIDWHPNIMTIHRLLGYYPEWYEDFDPAAGLGEQIKKKVRFVPAYDKNNKLPWKVIVIDEAGMLSVDLWHNLLDACTDDCRIYMIGDINQLPPTHGRSIFGFAMAKWPTWELTTIHRQKGENNSIVDNAWRVINGKTPIGDDTSKSDWKFAMMEVDTDPNKASKQLRKWLSVVRAGGVYDPIRDTVITPINAYDETSGFALGQEPLNQELTLMFHTDEARYVIDAGRDRRQFAVGDKVMVTKNDHEAEITNGMQGQIISIERNGAYSGNVHRYGLLSDVHEYLMGLDEPEDVEFNLTALSQTLASNADNKKEKERDRGPSSHVVTVRFGEGTAVRDVPFSTLSEVSTLVTAYVVTCHKMQGGEAPLVIVICHQSHKRMLYREWLYTAITRASEKCVLLYTKIGLASACNDQKIKGKDLQEKVAAFNKLQDPKGLMGASVRVILPEARKMEA